MIDEKIRRALIIEGIFRAGFQNQHLKTSNGSLMKTAYFYSKTV